MPTMADAGSGRTATGCTRGGGRLHLVSAQEIVDRPIEELPDHGLPALQPGERKAVSRELHEPVVADVTPKVMLGEDHGVDELADRDALAKALASPVLVPRADGVVGGADPVAEVAVEGADARLDLLARHLAEGRRSRVGEEILQGFARQAVRVVLDQLDQSVGEHGRGSSCASPALMTPHPRSPALPSGWPSGALRP